MSIAIAGLAREAVMPEKQCCETKMQQYQILWCRGSWKTILIK
jgi:hypothetical protein